MRYKHLPRRTHPRDSSARVHRTLRPTRNCPFSPNSLLHHPFGRLPTAMPLLGEFFKWPNVSVEAKPLLILLSTSYPLGHRQAPIAQSVRIGTSAGPLDWSADTLMGGAGPSTLPADPLPPTCFCRNSFHTFASTSCTDDTLPVRWLQMFAGY